MAIRVPEIDYYSLHGIWGAYASLALGRLGRGAGVVVGDVHPPNRGLFVGYGMGSEEPRLLPFVPLTSAEESSEGEGRRRPRRAWFTASEIERRVSLSGEEWKAGSLSLGVVSFFGEVPDPGLVSRRESRARMRPSLLVKITFDNSAGPGPMTGIFAMQGMGRPLSDATRGALLGAASGRLYGFAAKPEEGIEEVMDWDVVEATFDGERPLRRLASQAGLRFRVGSGERREFLIALGVFREGRVTAGIPARAYHSCLFKDLEEVLEEALAASQGDLARAAALDAELDAADIGEDRAFLLAHAAHSYAANTELLLDEKGAPLFVVNEGEYRMMNTLDLTIDLAFWEARFSPWTIRNVLDSYLSRYSYVDACGAAFTHDQGLADCFSPSGRSAYEMPGLTGLYSYMSFEETLNWVLSSCLYASLCGDEAWLSRRRDALAECVRSLRARDADGDGVMDLDSDRCEGGAEITTYDSLDGSLGQARNNLYLAVKAWAAFVCAASALERAGLGEEAELSRAAALSAARTIAGKALAEGYIPAVFEGENRSRIIPAIEGLIYPRFCGAAEALDRDGMYGALIRALERHLGAVLVPGACLDPSSGGWKLSSTSGNTWLSKIFLNQYVAESILGMDDERTRRDSVHAQWLRSGSADFAATDQVDSASGKDLGSRLYPRLVTAALWLPSYGRPRKAG